MDQPHLQLSFRGVIDWRQILRDSVRAEIAVMAEIAVRSETAGRAKTAVRVQIAVKVRQQ
jgi:hypothetical protein